MLIVVLDIQLGDRVQGVVALNKQEMGRLCYIWNMQPLIRTNVIYMV